MAMVFKALKDENDREVNLLRHRHLLATMNAPWLDDNLVADTQKQAIASLEDVLSYYMPWEYHKKTSEERERQEANRLRGAWQHTFGDLNDPEVQKKVAAVRAALLARVAENQAPESPLSHQGVFNRETADHIGALKAMSQQNDRSSVN